MSAEQTRKLLLGTTIIVVLLIAAGTIGYVIGSQPNPTPQSPQEKLPKDPVKRLLMNMSEGDSVIVNLEEKQTPEHKETVGSQGANVSMKSDRAYFRGLSWFGLGATEAAAKDQGFSGIQQGGEIVEGAGQQKGYGILEQLWQWIKSVFWTLAFVGVVLAILAFVPATAPFARAIWRVIAGLIPALGSFVEWLIGTKKQEKFEQVVSGGENFKRQLEVSDLSAEDKQKVKEIFKNSQQGSQDKETQKEVKNNT
ncbi:MAG: hypothetical protein ACOC5T_01380 [Elusimicrobiota bacterium]